MTDRLELLAVVALGFLLDQVLGDPHWLYHPVRLIGAYISFLEKGIRKLFGEGERALCLCQRKRILLAVNLYHRNNTDFADLL